MEKIHIIDLNFLQESHTIAAFLIESNNGPLLIETGPESTWTQLEKGINQLGYQPADIKHVFLTHIHFDHAGAAWKLAESGAQIYVHPVGLPHLASPERLWDSAAKIYGNDMERLWGKMMPVPKAQLKGITHGEALQIGGLTIKALHTPGHAVHHIAWQLDDTIFTGDVAGVKINEGPVVPPCPPPDIHLENWKASIALLYEQNPRQIYLTHFGRIDEPQIHLDELGKILMDWANWIKPHYEQQIDPKELTPKFMDYTQGQFKAKNVSKTDIKRYEIANPSWMSVAGLLRYWKLKDQGRI